MSCLIEQGTKLAESVFAQLVMIWRYYNECLAAEQFVTMHPDAFRSGNF